MYEFKAIDQAKNIANKKAVWGAMQSLVSTRVEALREATIIAYHENASFNCSHPINEIAGIDAIQTAFWAPLRHAMPDVERRDDIVMGGHYNGGDWVAMVGNYVGTFDHDWFDIPATHNLVTVRYGEGHHIVDGKIATSYVILDLLDLMRQAGFWPIAPSLGMEGRWLAPMTHDGVQFSPQDDTISQRSIEGVLAMHQALAWHDRRPPTRAELDKMQMVSFWHPNMMWYGPSGIGTTRGLKGFEDFHLIPRLVAFPDRQGTEKGQFVRIGDGNYAAIGGWGYLTATHTGHNWLGMPATGRTIATRVIDFYRYDGEMIAENWTPIDVIHMLLQMGVDVLGRMRLQFRQHEASSVSDWMVSS